MAAPWVVWRFNDAQPLITCFFFFFFLYSSFFFFLWLDTRSRVPFNVHIIVV